MPMTPEAFSALTHEEQIANLQRLGEAALAEFGVVPERIEPLVHAENTTFHVFSPQGEFNLRISRPGYQSTANIQSEIAFLSALRAEGFRVPDPYGGRLVNASDEGVPEGRNCVLFRWLGGEFRRKGLVPSETVLIGETMARLHDFTTHWSRPEGFDRQYLHAWAAKPRPAYIFDNPIDGIPEEDRLLLLEVDKEARHLIPTLPQTPDLFCLIHSDMHVGNVLFEDGHLNVIDFDDTGFGFFVYDVAAALTYLVLDPIYPEFQDALFEGYARVRPLPPRTEELLNPFLRIRAAGIASWILHRTDNPKFREIAPEFVGSLCQRIRAVASHS